MDRFKDAEIVRTRDAEILKEADVVLDVGGVYDPQTHRYDHHQPEFKDSSRLNSKRFLSSAGLVYKHFGKEILASKASNLSQEQIDALYVQVYESFVEAFDANDNGISAYPADIKPAFTPLVSTFSLMSICWIPDGMKPSHLNPQMNHSWKLSRSFQIFSIFTLIIAKNWLPARDIVVSALESHAISVASSAETAAVDSKILILPTSCPWRITFFNTPGTEEILCQIYPEGANASWRIQACPESPDSFISRLPLPEAWRGLRDAELDAALTAAGSEITSGAVFVHRSGFIGGHKTKEGTITMARLAIKLEEEASRSHVLTNSFNDYNK